MLLRALSPCVYCRSVVHSALVSTYIGAPQKVQYVVKAGTWFGSFPHEGTPYALVGCTVAPGFAFEVRAEQLVGVNGLWFVLA